MELNIDMSAIERNLKETAPKEIKSLIKKAMEGIAVEWEAEAKMIVSDGAMDTGAFANSIHYEMYEDGEEIGFVGHDGVNYGVYFEYGVEEKHWVPFYYYNDTSKPILAPWGKRVLGLSEEEMLSMQGIEVSTPELKPFLRGMEKAQSEASEIFKETFSE